MSKIMRMCVLVASLMSLFAVMSSTAGAVTWSNDGGTAFTATSGPGTLSGGGSSLACASGDATGTAATGPFVGATWTAASGTVRFTTCNIGGIPHNVHCRYTLTATGQSVPSVTNGNVDVTCDVNLVANKICHIEGSVPGHYVNPPSPRVIITHAASGLTPTDVSGDSCPLSPPVTLTTLTFNLTSGSPPIITRRP
jgi:hypothetical protein